MVRKEASCSLSVKEQCMFGLSGSESELRLSSGWKHLGTSFEVLPCV